MSNPFLKRIQQGLAAKAAPHVAAVAKGADKAARVGKDLGGKAVAEAKTWKSDRKVGLGLGATSLGLSLVNMHQTRSDKKDNERRIALEQKSLTALNKIHSALQDKKA